MMPTRPSLARLLAASGSVLWILVAAAPLVAQRHRWHDEGFEYRHVVELPPDLQAAPQIVVSDFFTHGALAAGEEVAVYGNRERVPQALLQQGPGDYCRVGFQTRQGESRYFIYYGGKGTDSAERPKWTARAGLLLETRRWKSCDLDRLDAVRSAFAEAPRIGADFVPHVFHRHNPFDVEPGPFLSRYTGSIRIEKEGVCRFFTSSQDCSFLLIDDQLVVAAPGVHPPERRARIKGEVTLTPGIHRFEYYHAASGDETCMVAAWQPLSAKAPAPISPDAFGSEQVVHLAPVLLEHREDGYLPDFRMAVIGDIPSPDDEPALVRVQFADTTTRAITANARFAWNFGDGQSSQQRHPGHVFLRPQLYEVKLHMTRGLKDLVTTNRIYVTRQFIVDPEEQGDEDLAEYLERLEQYNAMSLEPVGLVQLVRAYLRADEAAKAVEAGKMAFTSTATSHSDTSRWALINLIGPPLRNQVDDPEQAAELWAVASRLIAADGWRAACAIEAADILLNDLLAANQARRLLDFATDALKDVPPKIRSRYHRVLGDWYARSGDREQAVDSYLKAEAVRELPYNAIERNAWRGAHSRSAEAFLRDGDLLRARAELDQWQDDFPDDKRGGFFSVLSMRYWIARKKYPQAMAVAHDLLVVDAHSSYADQIILLTAQCEEQLGQISAAVARLESLRSDYPGSPLVETARGEIERIKKEQVAKLEEQKKQAQGKPQKKAQKKDGRNSKAKAATADLPRGAGV